jgi:hypothetical protein
MLVCTSAMQSPENRQKALERAAAASHSHSSNLRSSSEDDDDAKPQNGGEVRICAGCITRERKRAARKKIKKVEEEDMWNRDEARRVIVFNTQEVKEWQSSSDASAPNGVLHVDVPMRIACYCRHHGEKLGFQVIFTIKDHQDRLIAQEMSSSIMITDDHKTPHLPAHIAGQASQNPEAMMPVINTPLDTSSLNPGAPFRLSHSSSDLQSLQRTVQPPFPPSGPGIKTPTSSMNATPRSLSRPASPSHSGPMSKRRKGSGPRVPIQMAMTRLDTSPPPASQPAASVMSNSASAATSPFTPSMSAFPATDALFAAPTVSSAGPMAQHQITNGPPTPNSNDQGLFSTTNNRTSLDHSMVMSQMYSAPTSAHPSRAPSPTGLRNSGVAAAASQAQLAQALANSLYSLPIGVSQARPQPIIHKIIPNEGPKSGGIEVTILGAGFCQGLDVLFGDLRATTTTYWGESSLVCLVPPSPTSGTVLVSLKQPSTAASQGFQPMVKNQATFKYIDDDEDKLIRTALSVLGHKMSGNFVDVAELARRILGSGGSNTWNGGGGSSPSAGGAQLPPGSMFNNSAADANTESQLLKCLELIDLDDSTNKTRLDLKRSTGQTMLHLACSLGFQRFVAGLLARGANFDARDKGGFTPMHLAAMNNHTEIVRRLIHVGADPTIRSLSGLAPADVAQSRSVLRAIRLVERHVRSRSGGSLHSRAGSTASLRSLWEPRTADGLDAANDSEESPEYSSDYDGTDTEDNSWLDMRRPSASVLQPAGDKEVMPEAAVLDESLASPANAIAAAFREQFATQREQFAAQFQQFQQAMAMHMPNLAQFPNLPQIPTFQMMPMLPNYQAYLESAPFMRRVTSLVPGMSGSRPGSADDGAAKTIDSRWWDLSSLVTNNAAPPPAYDEIFPDSSFDKKQASAAQAAAEAEADSKCAALYDQPQAKLASTSAAPPPPAAITKTRQLPSVLMIGRKNAITKEQQEHLLQAHEEKFKNLSSDGNLFFIWVCCVLQ